MTFTLDDSGNELVSGLKGFHIKHDVACYYAPYIPICFSSKPRYESLTPEQMAENDRMWTEEHPERLTEYKSGVIEDLEYFTKKALTSLPLPDSYLE